MHRAAPCIIDGREPRFPRPSGGRFHNDKPEGSRVTNISEEQEEFCVLVNAEGQHSLWPTFREPPPGWTATGPRGARRVCLDWIDAHWTDMRPRTAERPSTPG